LTCPSTKPLAAAKALTMWMADLLPCFREPLTVYRHNSLDKIFSTLVRFSKHTRVFYVRKKIINGTCDFKAHLCNLHVSTNILKRYLTLNQI
jgi:hypothetical protein